jgi:hypothetical protein
MTVQEVIMTNVGTINADKLDADIRAAVATYAGHCTRPAVSGIILIFRAAATAEEIATAQGLVTAHDPNVKTAEQRARADLKAVAQTAVGVNYNDLTTVQLKALLAVLIFESDGIADDLSIKPLAQWVR